MFHVSDETRARLTAWREHRNQQDAELVDLIRDARAENGSFREIGEIVGLSHTEVRRILNKAKGATP